MESNKSHSNKENQPLVNIILIGLPGSGKTSLGEALAQKLGFSFKDSDRVIEEESGQTIPSLFEKGESYFRRIESQVLIKLSQERGIVLATGGGAVLRAENMHHLKNSGKVIWIDRPLEKIKEDLDPSHRPLLAKNLQKLDQLNLKRRPLYEGYADHHYINSGNFDQALAELSKLAENLLP